MARRSSPFGGRPRQSSRRSAAKCPTRAARSRSSLSASSYSPLASSSRISGSVGIGLTSGSGACATSRRGERRRVPPRTSPAARELTLREAAVVRVRVVGVDEPQPRIALARCRPACRAPAPPSRGRTAGSRTAESRRRRSRTREPSPRSRRSCTRTSRTSTPRARRAGRSGNFSYSSLNAFAARSSSFVTDVVGAEIVQRLFGPRAVGKLGDERARQRDVRDRDRPARAGCSDRRIALRPFARRRSRYGCTPSRAAA